MRSQHNRLSPDTKRGFAGSAIDRSRPLQFRLDGRLVSGFAGDTVLSATLASGIDTLGRHGDNLIGLGLHASPAISLASDPATPLPMARTPAVNGAEFVIHGAQRHGTLTRLFQPGRTLGLSLDRPGVLDPPWRSLPAASETNTDLVVVGGGVAGLSAALSAANAGLKVTLLEAHPYLGGHSGLFGTQDGEDSPEENMARLAAQVHAHDAITVLTSTHAYAARAGKLRAHRVTVEDGKISAAILDIETPRMVVATGAIERLPVFSGNRLPGVSGTLEAYELASRFGIWPGQSAAIATAGNAAYRLATLASDIGIAIPRIVDSRPAPASRFIEFTRAYGIVQAPGAMVTRASIGRQNTLSIDVEGSTGGPLQAERLLVSGGWQPDLTLWHIAGGNSHWHPARHRLEAEGELEGIALAGSAAGVFTRRGCMASGIDAVDRLLGRPGRPVDDPLIDPLYESPDAPCPVVASGEDAAAYLDFTGLLARPRPRRKGWTLLRRYRRSTGLTALSEAPQPLDISEVAAGVDLGLIPADAAGVVARERVALVPLAQPAAAQSQQHAQPAQDHVPPFLAGRFGTDAQVVRLVLPEPRRLEPGTLIYQTADANQPLMAVGVVLRQVDKETMAFLGAPAIRAQLPLTLRDHGRAIVASVAVEA